jgi:hypothetical protein
MLSRIEVNEQERERKREREALYEETMSIRVYIPV